MVLPSIAHFSVGDFNTTALLDCLSLFLCGSTIGMYPGMSIKWAVSACFVVGNTQPMTHRDTSQRRTPTQQHSWETVVFTKMTGLKR